jgi:regulator of sirC expression with transglutaminase-like and TPR domain
VRLLPIMSCVKLCNTLGLLSLIPLFLQASQPNIKVLYNSLDPKSIRQHIAFYELFSDSNEGKDALKHACMLLSCKNSFSFHLDPTLFKESVINSIVGLVNQEKNEGIKELGEEELDLIEFLASSLKNRSLKGRSAKTEEEILALKPEEIDLARGLFLTQLGHENLRKIRSYEAQIDLMALQILASLEGNTPEEKIRKINDFIFFEMGFRFPPHSIYAKNIDLYTFLPSVLDSRRGVCLGVSILYMCLAQRLGLHLEMVTPPGHIYVRYRDHGKEINIETTARGIHIDSEEYLSVNTKALEERNIKEVIGLAHFNEASVYWGENQYEKALASYKKALPYLKDDKLLMELMGYNFLFTGNIEEGEKLLTQVKDYESPFAVFKENIANDYLNGKVNVEGIKAVFLHVDETRASILKKKLKLEAAVKEYPEFKAGLLSLAVAWLQLHRYGEGLEVLKKYHTIEGKDPTAEYYLTMLYLERFDYNLAWDHFKELEKILITKNHQPKLLKDLKRELVQKSPFRR